MKCTSCNPSGGNNLITETKFWIVTLSSKQEYLGRCYVTLKRHCGSLSELTLEEWENFAVVVEQLEAACKKSLSAVMFNWTCLMNMAYQEKPPQPHVHWHFRPRYDHDVMILDTQFVDPEFGHHYSRDRKQIVNPKVSREIIAKIKAHL